MPLWPPASLCFVCFIPGSDTSGGYGIVRARRGASAQHRTSRQILENHPKSMKINENHWKSMKINENVKISWFLMILNAHYLVHWVRQRYPASLCCAYSTLVIILVVSETIVHCTWHSMTLYSDLGINEIPQKILKINENQWKFLFLMIFDDFWRFSGFVLTSVSVIRLDVSVASQARCDTHHYYHSREWNTSLHALLGHNKTSSDNKIMKLCKYPDSQDFAFFLIHFIMIFNH